MGRRVRRIIDWPSPLDPFLYTLILGAYFLPWIDHPTAGLTFIGLDVSEWIKFLPQIQSGELPNRDLLYLPPICLGGCLAASTLLMNTKARWPGWALRFLAIGIGLLAFPSLDALRFEPADQWRSRLLWIGLLTFWALGVVPLIDRLLEKKGAGQLAYLTQFVLAAAGAILPAVVLLPTRRVAAEWLRVDLAVGWGFWLVFLAFGGVGLLSAGRFLCSLKQKSGQTAAFS